jgi:hypothetical protein
VETGGNELGSEEIDERAFRERRRVCLRARCWGARVGGVFLGGCVTADMRRGVALHATYFHQVRVGLGVVIAML